jgi:hypothetical protein
MICLGAFLVTALVYTAVNTAFFVRLKRHERKTWQSLGSPMTATNFDMANFAAVRSFLKSGAHLTLQDSKAARLGNAVLLWDKIFLACIAVVLPVVGYVVVFIEP